MFDKGLYTSVSEIGDAESISKSYVGRILRLAQLAPDIVKAILSGRTSDPRSHWRTSSCRCRRAGGRSSER